MCKSVHTQAWHIFKVTVLVTHSYSPRALLTCWGHQPHPAPSCMIIFVTQKPSPFSKQSKHFHAPGLPSSLILLLKFCIKTQLKYHPS